MVKRSHNVEKHSGLAESGASVEVTEETITINLKKFRMRKVEPGCTMLITGKRRSGKSVLIEDIMYNMRYDIDIPIAFVGSHDTAEDYAKHMPRTHIHVSVEFDIGILENLLSLCKVLDKTYKATAVPGAPKYEQVQRRVVVFIDDMMADKSWTKDPKVNEIILNGRHMGIDFIVSTQYIMHAPQEHKSQADYTFVFNDDSPEVLKRLYEGLLKGYRNLFDNRGDFDVKFPAMTSDYNVLVIDRSTTSKHGGQVRIYKANYNLGPFTIGSDTFWALVLRYQRTKEQMRDQAYNEFQNVVGNIMSTLGSKPSSGQASKTGKKRKGKTTSASKSAKVAKKKRKLITSDQISIVIDNDSDEEPSDEKACKTVRLGDDLSLADSASIKSNTSSRISYDSKNSSRKR